MKICTLCGQPIIEGQGYSGSNGLEVFHKDCAFDYFKGQQENGNCFCGGCISEDGFCEECGTVADDSSLSFVYDN